MVPQTFVTDQLKVEGRRVTWGLGKTPKGSSIQAELKRLEQEARFLEVHLIWPFGIFVEVKKALCFQDPLRPVHLAYLSSFCIGLYMNFSSHAVSVYCLKYIAAIEELEQLERMDRASAACSELLSNVETSPDPLLPATHGPVNPLWDRWFEGPQDKKGCRCWIL
ncbi:hypothetical protein TIFTF001_015989 [Ficus carica]|uniref:G protein gamma domain-containing protein n=1 Tax=Ficus carica TaxID=3494 RepID=A0AA88A296_FICCA|nr:hypothetical protein TIFTF001_015989 [Ficus carica]